MTGKRKLVSALTKQVPRNTHLAKEEKARWVFLITFYGIKENSKGVDEKKKKYKIHSRKREKTLKSHKRAGI